MLLSRSHTSTCLIACYTFDLWVLTFLLWYKKYHNDEVRKLRAEDEFSDEINPILTLTDIVKIFKYYRVARTIFILSFSINIAFFDTNMLERLDTNLSFLYRIMELDDYYDLYWIYINQWRRVYWFYIVRKPENFNEWFDYL